MFLPGACTEYNNNDCDGNKQQDHNQQCHAHSYQAPQQHHITVASSPITGHFWRYSCEAGTGVSKDYRGLQVWSRYAHINLLHESIREPQLPTAPRPRCQPVTQCVGCTSANCMYVYTLYVCMHDIRMVLIYNYIATVH